MVVFYPGEPRPGDLNFIPHVFGRGFRYNDIPRALIFGSAAHFKAASRAWFR